MAGNKRRPSRDLNHENWNDEEEPEDGGVFQQASADEIGRRKILKPRRNLQNNQASGAPQNPFSAFNFGAPIAVSSSPPVLAPADSITSGTSDDSNSNSAQGNEVSSGRPGAAAATGSTPSDFNNEVDSSTSSNAGNNVTRSGQENAEDRSQTSAPSSSGLNENVSRENANGESGAAHRQSHPNEEASSEADAYSTDSFPEHHSRFDRTRPDEEDDEIASSSNNADADNEDSSNDRYYTKSTPAEAEADDSNSVDIDNVVPVAADSDHSKSADTEDIDSTVQDRNDSN